ncbi:copper amine oxidase-like protein [Paenibacillus cellulosilyticus]|uniref:Copper amine oxidase-like protein n=1 Tax=Paenibacillus cellulosilyticus TaxID=375489 RepID=A0A2V2YSP6_9BACL|nr:copper amine oxidase N-terminal domain-containing protein [Paenibacillus cellulosilyticus]PWW01228.1 copper amine oxidase-like protein [Paenibacillus cellulosilyticus]QKS46817.1 copper amine oxidase N-terminal domain-containing protein [Paenibacillus cellulosilyticus]
MKKKLLLLLATVSMLCGSLATTVQAADGPYSISKLIHTPLPIEVLVNARKIAFTDARPFNENGSVLVPVRVVSDNLGGKLSLVGKNITIVKGDRTIKLTIGAKTATVNGKSLTLNAPANAVNGRTYVPLRFVSEAFGESVEWDSVNQFVWIGKKDIPKLEDVAKLVDIKPFLPYYKGVESLLDPYWTGTQATKAYVLEEKDFPFLLEGSNYYRWDLIKSVGGSTYIRSSTTQTGSMGTGLFFLSKEKRYRDRGELAGIRESIDGYRIHYYSESDITDKDNFGDTNYMNFKLSQVDYIGISSAVDTKAFPILIKNPFN